MKITTQDLRISSYEKLIEPTNLISQIPLTIEEKLFIKKFRTEITNILNGSDKRFLVIVGPCSIHDTDAALEYAYKLKQISDELNDKLLIVMRCYFEKPRTTIGWKGFINDPYLNNTFKINDGLYKARYLLKNVTNIGLPIACELLDTITPQYFGDLISWGAIGARTSESQLHRELVSGLSFPCAFKNATNGDIDIALDAIISASNTHSFIGVTPTGNAAIVKTIGNKDCHIILRGGKYGTNYDLNSVNNTISKINLKGGMNTKIMIDCSHGNSQKNYKNQITVLNTVLQNLKLTPSVIGVMIESNLKSGNQPLIDNLNELEYGKSITDACVNWNTTLQMLYNMYSLV
jgi:3-deoxy-7-phosphoheptulonate synthase